MSGDTEEEEEEDLNYCKLQTLKELFPQKSDQALLKVQYYDIIIRKSPCTYLECLKINLFQRFVVFSFPVFQQP